MAVRFLTFFFPDAHSVRFKDMKNLSKFIPLNFAIGLSGELLLAGKDFTKLPV